MKNCVFQEKRGFEPVDIGGSVFTLALATCGEVERMKHSLVTVYFILQVLCVTASAALGQVTDSRGEFDIAPGGPPGTSLGPESPDATPATGPARGAGKQQHRKGATRQRYPEGRVASFPKAAVPVSLPRARQIWGRVRKGPEPIAPSAGRGREPGAFLIPRLPTAPVSPENQFGRKSGTISRLAPHSSAHRS
jgi:hypothetical protein